MSQEILNQINNFLLNNKPKKAIDCCKKEIDKFINRDLSKTDKEYLAEIYYILSGIYASCGKMKEALHWINNAILNNPHDETYYYYRAEMNVEKRDYETAIQDYTKSIKLNPSSVSYGKRGSAKILAGNYNGAVIDCTKALKLNPDFGAGYIERGRAKHKTENFVGAIKDFSKAIEMFPEFALPYGLRGDAKIKTGDIEGAIEDFKKLKQLDPRSEVAKHALKNISKMQKQNNENLTTVVSERNQKRDSLLGVIKNLIKK